MGIKEARAQGYGLGNAVGMGRERDRREGERRGGRYDRFKLLKM